MSKIVILLVVAAVAATINAMPEPEPSFGDFSMFAFPDFTSFFDNFPRGPMTPEAVMSPDEIKNLKGDENTKVEAVLESHSSKFKSENGKTVEDTESGRKITNDNGIVKEESY